MKKTIRILLIEPKKEPYILEVENLVKEILNRIGKRMSIIPVETNTVVVLNDKGKLLKQFASNKVMKRKFRATTIIVAKDNLGELCSLTNNQIEKYKDIFKIRKYDHIIKNINNKSERK